MCNLERILRFARDVEIIDDNDNAIAINISNQAATTIFSSSFYLDFFFRDIPPSFPLNGESLLIERDDTLATLLEITRKIMRGILLDA